MRSLLLLCAAATTLVAQTPSSKKPPTAADLEAITARGRLLAEHDRAAWNATDVVLPLIPPSRRPQHYIARRMGDGWTVSFGALTAQRDSFLVAYEAHLAAGDSIFRAAALREPRPDTGYIARAARATELARTAFGAIDRPYNSAVIPAEGGAWWVYVFPAQTREGVWPLGADERFHVSADGRQLLARRRLHKAVVEYDASANKQITSYMHAAILDDIPEDTDVHTVLMRRPLAPEYIITEAFVFRVNVDGSIAYVGRREEVVGKSPPRE